MLLGVLALVKFVRLFLLFFFTESSPVALAVKNLLAGAGDVREADSIPGSGRSPGGGQATHSSVLVWRIP